MDDEWGDHAGEPPAILSEVRDGVGIVTLNRPDKLNAWTPAMGTLYFDTLEAMALDDGVRAILLTSAGRAFCAGADMTGLKSLSDKGGVGTPRDPRRYWFPMSIGKPIVAAIKGPCYGVGLQQALVADIRFAAHDARLCAPYVRRGLIGEVGITWLLTRLIGLGRATDMMLSARVIDAGEAMAMGLVNRLCSCDDLFDEAFAYCQALALENSPWAMRHVKQQLYHDLMRDFTPAFLDSEALLDVSMSNADFAEGIAAFREKRSVQFPPLPAALAKLDPWPS